MTRPMHMPNALCKTALQSKRAQHLCRTNVCVTNLSRTKRPMQHHVAPHRRCRFFRTCPTCRTSPLQGVEQTCASQSLVELFLAGMLRMSAARATANNANSVNNSSTATNAKNSKSSSTAKMCKEC